MKIQATDFVMYQVSDLGVAVQFYRDALGLKMAMCSGEHQWAEFDTGNVTLALHGGQEVLEPGGGARIALAVDDLDAAYAALLASGTRVLHRPQDHGVCRAFEVLDPDGNVILLHQRADGTCG
ncbi:MAG TPA: VOC family protein [Opitutaceae bacterium]|nr:VOC family protein [Opitutaceae bacterium]